jgi:hypothetical protein
MPIKSYKMGPGVLTLGTAPLDVSCQVRAFTVKASEQVDRTDPVPVLCGEELPAEEVVSFTWQVVGTLLQDLAAAGVIDWSWTNKGTWQAFKFVPSTAEARQVTGQVRPVPLDVGGEVVKSGRPTSDLTWAARGSAAVNDPTFAAAV